MYSHDPFFGTSKNRILKTDRVNGPIDLQTEDPRFSCQIFHCFAYFFKI